MLSFWKQFTKIPLRSSRHYLVESASRFHDENDLEPEMSTLAHEIHDGYTLIYPPTSRERGFHAIRVEVLNARPRLAVTFRTNYWFDGVPAD